MDINEKINTLTEAEAKDALKWLIEFATVFMACDECPFEDDCLSGATVKECECYFFDCLLKEARK